MQLKEYQQRALAEIRNYLEFLADWRKKADDNPDLEIDFPAKAWEKAIVPHRYISRKNGLGRPLPNFCLKIPTGGGKTLLAVKTIDLANMIYRRKKSGLVLWIVPTTQIYRQTIKSLKDRDHPYRQHLDMASGGRTLILEKTDCFSPQDTRENLVVLMLMLPSANRKTKETLKVFKDSGGFQDFFPPEDDVKAQEAALKRFPNLDTYEKQSGFWGRQIKTSLGNTLRTLEPLIILDEGHKAYSEGAQSTLRGFNPCLIAELSATPAESNILVDITGRELHREDMIKLDLHVVNKASPDWKDAMLAGINKRNVLEEKAKEYEANTGINIRPICLIQVERTGSDQQGGRWIHSEQVREHLNKIIGIPAEQIAVKTSEKDELKEVDDVGGLMTRDCNIRYIITKQALQEGWDCAFAYVLVILANPSSQNSLTQFVGRILRQPYARKTQVRELDESYVFCSMLEKDELRFLVIGNNFDWSFPKSIAINPAAKRLTRSDGGQLELSLFEFVPEDDFNETEKAVAWYLENQRRLFFWFRNRSRHDYAIQGWRQHKIYPDFILTATDKETRTDYERVYVVETKGLHLKDNAKTDYIRKVFDICAQQAQSRNWNELGLEMKDKALRFEVLAEDEWEAKLNEMLSE